MENKENRTAKTPLEDLRNDALKHYEEASNSIHHWSSFVVNAIQSYNPDSFNLIAERDSYKKAFEELHDTFVRITDKIKFIK